MNYEELQNEQQWFATQVEEVLNREPWLILANYYGTPNATYRNWATQVAHAWIFEGGNDEPGRPFPLGVEQYRRFVRYCEQLYLETTESLPSVFASKSARND